MSSRNIVLLVVAVIIAGAVAMAVKSRMPSGEPGAPAPVEQAAQRILVASKDIPAGTFVKAAADLQWAGWPEGTVQSYHIKEGAEEMTSYEGSVARRAIKAGEAITPNTLVKPGAGGFLSAVLEAGKRAISVAVSPTSGTAGFIFPGDRVDLIVTHRMKVKESEQGQEEENVVSETFVENVRVVAVDQMLDNPDNKAILAKTVTVEVTPDQAEQIAVAEDMGKISMALRSLAADELTPQAAANANGQGGPVMPTGLSAEDEEDFVRTLAANSNSNNSGFYDLHRYTRDRDVSPALNRKGGGAPRVLVIRGNVMEKREFYQDVR